MKAVATDKAPKAAGPYSQAVVHDGLVYVSGQIPVDPATGSVPEGMTAQAEQALKNLSAVLEAAGSGTGRALKVTVFISDMSQFAAVNEVYARFFAEPYPARTCVESPHLPKGVMIEIDAIGIVG
ncbi:MAG: RidA family protein [Candidatus Methanomethylophilaceae archaeon]|nr:RidA family protein [Candidatus Methanomethylophilaceae archaeon]